MTRAHCEIARVLAAQGTVALRNASLYRDVPFISLLEPVLEEKRRFLAMEKQRRALFLAGAAAVALFLIFFPIPMRLAGDATVAPVRKATVMSSMDGIVKSIYVHEGDRVQAGTILADLEDWDLRAALAAQPIYSVFLWVARNREAWLFPFRMISVTNLLDQYMC